MPSQFCAPYFPIKHQAFHSLPILACPQIHHQDPKILTFLRWLFLFKTYLSCVPFLWSGIFQVCSTTGSSSRRCMWKDSVAKWVWEMPQGMLTSPGCSDEKKSCQFCSNYQILCVHRLIPFFIVTVTKLLVAPIQGNFALGFWWWIINLISAYMFGINDCERIINLLILSIYNLPENLMRVSKRKFNVGSSV